MALYDPNLMAQASQKLGGSYAPPASPPPAAVPATPTAVTQPPPSPTPAAPPPVEQAKDTEVAGVNAAPPAQKMDLSKMQQGADMAASVPTADEKTEGGMKKLGALVGTVLSFYTGNYAGAAQGIKGMSDQGKAER